MNFALPSYEETVRGMQEKEKVRDKEAEMPDEITTTKLEGTFCPIAKKAISKKKGEKIASPVSRVAGASELTTNGVAKKKKDSHARQKGILNLDPNRVKIVNISYPTPIPPNVKTSKRFALSLDYCTPRS